MTKLCIVRNQPSIAKVDVTNRVFVNHVVIAFGQEGRLPVVAETQLDRVHVFPERREDKPVRVAGHALAEKVTLIAGFIANDVRGRRRELAHQGIRVPLADLHLEKTHYRTLAGCVVGQHHLQVFRSFMNSMWRLAPRQRKVMRAMMVTRGHQPEKSERLNPSCRIPVTTRYGPDDFVANALNLRHPAGLSGQNWTMRRDHAQCSLASAPGRVDLHPQPVRQSFGMDNRCQDKPVHVDEMEAQAVYVDAAPVCCRVVRQNRHDFGDCGEATIARFGRLGRGPGVGRRAIRMVRVVRVLGRQRRPGREKKRKDGRHEHSGKHREPLAWLQPAYRSRPIADMIAIMSCQSFFDRLEQACAPESARVIALEAGEALFCQGDAPPGLPFLGDGQVDLVRWTENGRSVRIHVAQRGETFAEASLFSEQCHCDAVATTSSVVRLLPKRGVLDAFQRVPELSQAFAIHLANSLMRARRLLELRAITPLTDRVRARLEELADAEGALAKRTTLLSVAADLDVTPAALYRTIATLETQGFLERPERGRVRLLGVQRNRIAPGARATSTS
jgi:CRP-like cAMP-binding protein